MQTELIASGKPQMVGRLRKKLSASFQPSSPSDALEGGQRVKKGWFAGQLLEGSNQQGLSWRSWILTGDAANSHCTFCWWYKYKVTNTQIQSHKYTNTNTNQQGLSWGKDWENGQNVTFFLKKLKLYCDPTVWFFQVFSNCSEEILSLKILLFWSQQFVLIF